MGKGSVAVYYSVEEIRKTVPNFSVKNTEIAQIPSADMVTAMKNKAVDCGVLLDPIWLQVANDPAFFLAATQTPGEPLGMVAFGKTLLQDHPEVGVAFTRAVIRTINTYFNGDYHQNPTVLAEIAKVTNQPTANLTRTPSLVMDWELRKDTATRIQELFIDLGVITEFKKPVPEAKIVDRNFYLKAVGMASRSRRGHRRTLCAMPRISVPTDEDPMMYVWTQRAPHLTGPAGALSHAVYGSSILSLREFEAARIAIARVNDCNVCLNWRSARTSPARRSDPTKCPRRSTTRCSSATTSTSPPRAPQRRVRDQVRGRPPRHRRRHVA